VLRHPTFGTPVKESKAVSGTLSLAAVTCPSRYSERLLWRAGRCSLSCLAARLISAALAVIVSWRSKRILRTIAVGMTSLWVLQAVMG